MDHNYWRGKWEANDIRFHQKDINRHLKAEFENSKRGRVFVPLCGKTKDMLWLVQSGYQVVGVELSEVACQAFFEENNLEFNADASGDYKIFRGANIEIWCGDFFTLPSELWSRVESIYDRAALIALPADLRKRYAASFTEHLNVGVEILLLTVEYDQSKAEGPPFSVTETEVRALYSKNCEIQKLPGAEQNIYSTHPKFENVPTVEGVYKLRRI